MAERERLIAAAPRNPGLRFRQIALLVLVIAAAADAGRLVVELRFFSPAALVATGGFVPVPQYNPGLPAVDRAVRLADSRLPQSAVCVIDRDAWTDDYQRASFLMLPRRLWPYADIPATGRADTAQLRAAMSAHHATCLLASDTAVVPAGLGRLTDAYYSLYVTPGRAGR